MQRPAPRTPGRPLVLGHRGAAADAPENTLASFKMAVNQGADGVELDVWRCASGELVVFHDDDGKRLASDPRRVVDLTLTEIKAWDVGAHKGEAFRGERVPLLREVLEAIPAAVVNIELKARAHRPGDPRLAAGVARLVRDLRCEERVIVSSFEPLLVAAFRLASPHVATGMLFEPEQSFPLRRALLAPAIRPSALHPERTLVTEASARRWRSRGYALNVWTVDAPEEVRRLCALGVAGVITNKPGATRALVREVTGR